MVQLIDGILFLVCWHGSGGSLVPRPLHPAFVAYSMKSGGRPGRIYHMMCATADATFSLAHVWVYPFRSCVWFS